MGTENKCDASRSIIQVLPMSYLLDVMIKILIPGPRPILQVFKYTILKLFNGVLMGYLYNFQTNEHVFHFNLDQSTFRHIHSRGK